MLLRLLTGQAVPRVPVAPFIHCNFIKAFNCTDDVDLVQRTIEVYEHFGFDLIHRNCTPTYDHVGASADGWNVVRQTTKTGREEATHTVIHTPDGDLTETFRVIWVVKYDAEAAPVDYLIKSERDFDILSTYQPPIDRLDTSIVTRARTAVGNRGVTAPWIQGAFNHVAYYYRRLDDLLLDAVTNPAFYHRMLSHFLERNKQIAAQMIDAGADVLSYGGNIASGKMVSTQFFRDYVFDYEKELIDFIQGRGAAVLYHNCGCGKRLFECYRQLGMRVYESLTAPPYGDTILEQALETLGPEMVLCGGLDQIAFLMNATPQAVESEVQRVLEVVRNRGRFILGTSDYFHEDTPHQNIAAIGAAARRVVGQ
jgi:acetolactate synthase regulatory subunit